MTQKVNPVPETYHTVTPYLVVEGAANAIEFYEKAFGAEQIIRIDAPGGRIAHADIVIGNSHVMLDAAAIVAGAQIAGGLVAPHIARFFRRRTTVLLTTTLISAAILALIGLLQHFWIAVTLLVVWGLMFAAVIPVRQTYLNALIPSEQRATVLSFDSLLGSSGGVVIQPILGKAADVWSYPISPLLLTNASAPRSTA